MSHPRGPLRRPTISVLCPTNHPGPLVAAVLEPLRGVVDEIVVAADARVGAGDLGWYATVADTLLRYEHIGPNRHFSWLAEQARGDWLLLLDGDELVSAAFVAALPELVEDARIEQYSVPIDWPWPDPGRRLVSEPWGSDRRARLIRNNGGTAFHGRKHALAVDRFPQRFLDGAPTVHHLDLLLRTAAEREEKVTRYEGQQFGLMTPEGQPFNRAFYLPESDPQASLAACAPSEGERIAAALARLRDPGPAPPPVEPGSVPLADRAEISRRWAHAAPPAGAYAGEVRVTAAPPRFTAGAGGHVVWVRARNDSDVPWRWGLDQPPLIRLGSGWRDAAGRVQLMPERAPFPCSVEPGAEELVAVTVTAPDEPGDYELLIDVVHEHVRWFEIATPHPVRVEPSTAARLAALPRIAPLAQVRALRRDAGRRDALVDDLVGTGAPHPSEPLEPALRSRLEGLATGGWALDEPILAEIAALVRAERPATALELGSGTSTVLLSVLMRELHGDAAAGTVVSLEQDPHWAAQTRAALAARGLEAIASVHHVPIGEPSPGTPHCYLPTPEATAALEAAAPQLVLVDGPTLDSGASRVGAVDLAAPFVRDGALLLLDDALRDAELLVAERWAARPDLTVAGITLIGKGLLVGRFSASAPRKERWLKRLLPRSGGRGGTAPAPARGSIS